MPAAIMQMAFNGIYIPLSMLTTAALDRIRSNDNLRYKKIPFGNGVGKQSLDDSFFPVEDSLDTATFLQAYQNWLSVVDKLADAALAKGWHCHHARMLADTAFAQHLSAWRVLDRTLRAQFTDKPFLVDPNDPTYFAMFERARNSIPQRAISYSDARPPRSSRHMFSPDPLAVSHSPRYAPYDKDRPRSGNSFRESRKPALCLRCGVIGHRASACSASHASCPERPILCEWRNDHLVDKSNKRVCIMFNVRGSCSDSSSPTHGEHSCALCGDQHHAASACPRN
ncbi:hypothetical protein JB92DRAFT_2716426 [Gautieria morchelliformis]|nr:hypothetical protein JB92DRAFT_2716426 [Gautieria morchelliformis]